MALRQQQGGVVGPVGPPSVPLDILRLSIKEEFVLELPKKRRGKKHFSNLIMGKKIPLFLKLQLSTESIKLQRMQNTPQAKDGAEPVCRVYSI